jgi:hypothetical protein
MDPKDVKTRVSVQFQYRGPNDNKPCDWTQEERLQFEVPAGTPAGNLPIPAVGDTVSLTLTEPGKQLDYRVLSRHYRYAETSFGLLMAVDFVVTDPAPKEIPAPKAAPLPGRRPVWGLAACVLVLSAVSAAALIGLTGERRHAATLAASNQSLDASVQDLQTQLRSVSDRIQALTARTAAVQPGVRARAARPVTKRGVRRSKPPGAAKGQVAFYRFHLAQSGRYNRVGPVSLSVRQVSLKHGSCDLLLKTANGRVERRHVNLREPVLLTLPTRRWPLELVVDQIGGNTVRGYISEPRTNLAQLATF